MTLGERIAEELNVETVFSFDVPYLGTVGISESIVVTWIVMAILVLASFLLTRNLKVTNISKRQAALELVITKLQGLVSGALGPNGGAYLDYLMTVLLYIGIANIMGVVGMKAPTKDLQVTIPLALMSIILVQTSCIKHRGVKGWLKTFASPSPVIVPIKILELFTRPLSLCMRLFGNVLGSFVIMELLNNTVRVAIPGLFGIYFDIFDGFIQAYVFVFLTGLFISEGLETEEE
ncbi:MAG: F0F1 ATP synthase subunit A [Lachnospiraceae bacterium]|nr:F0F1 ATP synthase subunit A [Lachnospiraceae bacterium]